MHIYRMKCGCCYAAMDDGMREGNLIIKRGFLNKKEDPVFSWDDAGADEGHRVDEEINVEEFIEVLSEMISNHEYEQQARFLGNIQQLFRDAIK